MSRKLTAAAASDAVELDADATVARSLVLLGANAAPGMTIGLYGSCPDP